ncbi:hypothetical protein BABINDRAFT_169865 [Babjeviella inositovora NRRL Y-12698]|uniref:Glucosamine 6-phosphate N-acetyltransferase n=1 Tax=Babjeviella inositovora NRRL Y-12698 TaxID=984486 RepID=A0A1E3QYD9_9ASCO|nr:uncharacterized protein BABINDRAFT_169865 [Babjeviella inositovora NRRL Y-12698]ODQ82631.1 hypothetical protein BABINDRAFT_169865 [Babjeviella inositovora NRRL Y-12698]
MSAPPLPEGYAFRAVQKSDYTNGYIETLKVLTTTGDISEAQFHNLVQHWETHSHIYKARAITDASGKIVATGMLVVEKKLIHSCGSVGHIEDIAVAKDQQGKQLGRILIVSLTALARDAGCYKVILDCSEHNKPFYEKCGYKHESCAMVVRL